MWFDNVNLFELLNLHIHFKACQLSHIFCTSLHVLHKCCINADQFSHTLGMGNIKKIHVTIYHESNYHNNLYYHESFKLTITVL